MIGFATRYHRGLLAGLAAASAFVAPAAWASPDETAQSTKATAEARYRALEAQVATRAGDPAFDYELGTAAVDAGRHGDAIIAFQRVLAVQPDNAPARAELARAYAMAGDPDTARQQFGTVVDDPTIPDPVRQRFTRLVQQLDTQIAGGGSDISGFLDASIGYDDNINAATELTTITIPLFAGLGPGTLGADARAQADEFYEVQGGVSAVTAIGRQDRLFASVLGNWRDNFDSDRFDQASVTGTAGFAHSFANRDVVSLSGQVQQFWLGREGFRQAYGAIAQYTHLLGGGKALSLSAQYNRFNFDRDPLRDADRFALAAAYVTRILSVNVIGGHEETRRDAGDANSNSFGGASVGAEVPVAQGVAVVGGVAFDLRRYDREDLLFLAKRADERVDVSLGVKIALTPNLFVRPRVTYARNWSNIALYDHERWTASAGIRFEF
ncbi:tetratricopeptide repeat protein [Sphingomonas baiyangensis]|uniref:Tetratricopeptide repeat protein n=1 Tax=Sphingomonas baiyangensis TaxID=2572576 RepID=A0A4U1KZZ6_9SPHN|nr:tetratricopeptide repeat protein [Sphingomonas baiyangensis]TKD49884.1 tetratricopeptide repeat protein [Sphingomonas baiyangensis]